MPSRFSQILSILCLPLLLTGDTAVGQHDVRRGFPGPRGGPRGEHAVHPHLCRLLPLRGARRGHAQPLPAQAARRRAHAGQLELLAAHPDAQPAQRAHPGKGS